MKTKQTVTRRLRRLRSSLLSAVATLDLRGTDERVTEAMCLIGAAFNAAIVGKTLSADEIVKLGLAQSKRH